MGKRRLRILVTVVAFPIVSGCVAVPPKADTAWDPARTAQLVDAARAARRAGDPMTAERLCYTAFEAVDRSALDAIDAYADLLASQHSAGEPEVRRQALKLRELKAGRSRSTEPTSDYLGFSPADTLMAFADRLAAMQQPDASQRMRSLALAYRQVQQAHFQRSLQYRRGHDPRGEC